METSNKEMQDNITFLDLINGYKITIPVIQRDYAQGRTTPKVTEIRDGFLSAIIDVLQSNEEKPLVLDFIYGSTNNKKVFTPLDGQQRLTTLFLLHWYFADNGTLDKLRTNKGNSVFSKFSYQTRISSKNFCDKLVQYDYLSIKQSYVDLCQRIEELKSEANSCDDAITKDELHNKIDELELSEKKWKLASSIKDQPWFFWAWQKDPTVSSMLTMLDDIESRLFDLTNEQKKQYFNRLEKIVFHLLPLEQFNLTDELYVKMNARGKELSEFDIFKSTLAEQMRLNNVDEKIQHIWQTNFDSNWVDIFWNKIAKPKLEESIDNDSHNEAVKEVELAYLRFLKRMMTFHLFTNDNCSECDWSHKKIKRYIPFEYTDDDIVLEKLRDYSVRNDISKLTPLFCKINFFDESFFNFIVNAFESLLFIDGDLKNDGSDLIENIGFEYQKSLFEAFIAENINYDIRVQFFALLNFFRYNSASNVMQDDDLKKEFNSWMRVIRNISTNTNSYFYNTYEDFSKSLKAIQNWGEAIYKKEPSTTIIKYLSGSDKLNGFDGGQLKEEQVKAKLILSSDEWKDNIIEIEEHKYFLGQIRFLLNWSKNENGYFELSTFKNYAKKIKSVFDNKGLVEQLKEKHLFKNSLMCVADWYLLNNCFVKYDNNKDRDWSWKRYLRDEGKASNVKSLLTEWDYQSQIDIVAYCKSYIEINKPTNWRKCFIEYPELFDDEISRDKKISWWFGEKGKKEFCLLSKTRWSSRHKELRSYYWFLKYKDSSNDKYLDSTEEIHPFSAIFKRDINKEFSVKFLPKWDNGRQQGQYVVSSNFDSSLEGLNQNDERWEKYFKTDEVEDIEELIEKLSTTTQQ